MARSRKVKRRSALWKVSISTTPEAEDAISELLSEQVGQPATSYTDLETGITTVAAYLNERPSPFRPVRDGLEKGLERLRRSRVIVGAGRISLASIRPRDWAESWKRHFKPIAIGRALLLRPSWSRKKPSPGQRSLILDPGLSFGTGHHPTTLFCLQQIVAWRNPKTAQSFLDLGTGSGILALAAARLRYAPVEAIDNDPDAVRVAQANARRNRLEHKIRFRAAELARLPKTGFPRYSLICANLIAPLLIEHRDRILARLGPSGRLVLAGILKTEAPFICSCYKVAGLSLVAARSQGEWRSLAFAWNSEVR